MKVQWTRISHTLFNCDSRNWYVCFTTLGRSRVATQSVREMAFTSERQARCPERQQNLISTARAIKSKSDRGPRKNIQIGEAKNHSRTSAKILVFFFFVYFIQFVKLQGPPLRYYTFLSLLLIALVLVTAENDREARKQSCSNFNEFYYNLEVRNIRETFIGTGTFNNFLNFHCDHHIITLVSIKSFAHTLTCYSWCSRWIMMTSRLTLNFRIKR